MNILDYLTILIILYKTQIYKYQENILSVTIQRISRVVEVNHWNYEEYANKGLIYVLQHQQMGEFTHDGSLLEKLGEYYCMTSSVIRIFDNCKKGVNGLVVQEKMGYAHNRVSSFINRVKNVCISGEKREEIGKRMQKYLSREVFPFVEGFLLGGSEKLSYEQKSEVKRAGVSHLLSASGSNVSLVLILNTPFLWKRFGRNFTGLLGVMSVAAYVSIAGCSAPLLRAAVGGSLLIMVTLMHRQASSLRILVLSCIILTIVSESFLTNIGFQLSAAATLGLCLFSKYNPKESREKVDLSMRIRDKIDWQLGKNTARARTTRHIIKQIANAIIGGCKNSLRTTLAAQAFTLPIILFHFHEMSAVVLVSNVALLWLMPYIITASVMLIIAATLNIHILAVVFGALTTILTHIFLKLVQLFGESTYSLLEFTQSQAYWIVFVYFVSTSIVLTAQKWFKSHMRERKEP